ncbi:major facilitator superfamily domain-containing protein [Lasiosphaeris hirsuta]|uniref:Major facilitator superfamily domain-containing protein n=1 Tax=Lasiosphaeris hirsuta TaxID=260670 RepID=A0AA40DG98_9PEZI|nr:major facilitator superfamily domain-containing protein [Lasiosphaeris hirsuta]
MSASIHQKEETDTEQQTVSGTAGDVEKETFPEGGLQAWLVAGGATGVVFSTLGFTNSFGVFLPYYLSHQLLGESPDNVAWIGSVQATLIFATGMVAGPLFDRYGVLVIRLAALGYVLAVMLTSICKDYWHFMLSQGVLSGITTGLLLSPSMAVVSQYFHRRRGAALGMVVAGSSAGGILFPTLLSKLLTETTIGFGWSVRICGFMILAVLSFSALAVRTRLSPRATRFFLPEAFRNPLYNMLIIATFFLFFSTFVPLFFIPTYAVSRGMDETLAGYLVAIVNGAGVPGRIIPGILGDKLGRLNALCAAGVSTSILIFFWTKAISTAGIIVFSVFIGFTSGALISGASVAFTLCPKDTRDVGTWLGQAMALASFAALAGPPANGALLKAYGGFEQVTYLTGSMCMVGALLVLYSKKFTEQGVWGRV